MKFNDIVNEEKVRLDPKCWTGKKIGNPKTKMKGGVRVNNCVPAESVGEAANPAQQAAIAIAMKKKGQKPHNEGAYDATVDAPRFVVDPAMANKLLTQYDELYQLRDPKYAQSGGVVMYSARPEVTDMLQKMASSNPQQVRALQPGAVQEDEEYDDEAGMADNNLETLKRAVDGLDDLISAGDNLPEWCQEKIAVAKSMLVAVWDYMQSEEAEDPEIAAMYEAMEDLVTEMSVKHRVSKDRVWEQFEAMPDNVLYETAAWRRAAGKSKSGGLNRKGVASYRRENPGSKLQMAVTTKPSKLKPGSKAAKRRKSFCARMSGVKGPMKKPNGKPTRKALALRKWNC
jgi:hypothetical protein